MTTTDLIVIGAGPGGYRAAQQAARYGLQVVVVEEDQVGGTCLNRGCIPTKTYVHARSFDEAVGRQPEVVVALRSGVEQLMTAPGITLVRGRGVFTGPHTVRVDDSEYTAPHIIIATGSSCKRLAVEGSDLPHVMDSTQLLQCQELPRRLCVIGAGVVGMEFASVFRRFGAEVMVIEYLKECLPMLDSDIAKRLRKYMERQGITFRMKTAVTSLVDLDADVILIATGRQPNVSPDFDVAGIAYDAKKGIAVNEHFETNVSGVYAIGDVNGRQMLAHAAEMQGIHVVNHLTGHPDHIRFDIMPSAIFTSPEAACVGLSEEQCKATLPGYRCRKAFWRANGKALAMDAAEGMLKLLSDADDRIVGCHAYGAHAADLVQETSSLMCLGATVSQLRDMVHIHPTLSEVLHTAAEQE